MRIQITKLPKNRYDIGGVLQSHGSDWSDGLVSIDAGSSHELNPNEGVQMGVDEEGVPNLVEEGEVIFNDYVYSNRIELDDEAKERFHFSKKRDITYADAAKSLEKEIAERPNDPISKAGFKAQMEDLAEEQERQKQEMEAERAEEAFDALSDEEKIGVMQYAQQQEQAAQEQAMTEEALAAEQQGTVSPEEMAMMQQQGMAPTADAMGTVAAPQEMMVQQAAVMAEGGNLFSGTESHSSLMKNTGSWKRGTQLDNWNTYTRRGLEDYLTGIVDRINQASDDKEKEKIRKEAIETVNGIQKAYAKAYQAQLSPSDRKDAIEALQKEFQKANGNKYFKGIADNINLPKGANTTDREGTWVDGYWGPRTSIRNWGTTEYGDADYKSIMDLAGRAGLTYAPMNDVTYGDNNYLYGLSMTPQVPFRTVGMSRIGQTDPLRVTEAVDEFGRKNVISTPVPTEDVLLNASNTAGIANRSNGNNGNAGNNAVGAGDGVEPVPVYRDENLRYAGLLGPAFGLGMQMLGIGRPNTGSLQAVAENFARNTPELATYKPIGNYMRYRPLDIWAEQRALDAQARATDRAIANTTNPAKMAGQIANSYASQLASGEAVRKGTESNINQNMQVENFNKGTDVFNAEAFTRNSQYNADVMNRNRQYASQLAMNAAQAKMGADAGWYQGIYGNVGNIFKGISDLGRENAQHNMIAEMAANGLFGPMSPSTWVGQRGKYLTWKPKKNCKGGKINKRRG